MGETESKVSKTGIMMKKTHKMIPYFFAKTGGAFLTKINNKKSTVKKHKKHSF